jgi:hypothetical protein
MLDDLRKGQLETGDELPIQQGPRKARHVLGKTERIWVTVTGCGWHTASLARADHGL